MRSGPSSSPYSQELQRCKHQEPRCQPSICLILASFRLTTEREQNEAEGESKAASSKAHAATARRWRYSYGYIVRLMRDCKGVVLSSARARDAPAIYGADCPAHIKVISYEWRSSRAALAVRLGADHERAPSHTGEVGFAKLASLRLDIHTFCFSSHST